MIKSQTNSAWGTMLVLDPDAGGPLHDRLSKALRAAIRSGRLPGGSAVPPSRALAADLGCSRWVVTQAYEQLIAEGYLEARTGSATRVKQVDTGSPPPLRTGGRPADRPRLDLAPGLPDLRAFPRRQWAEAIRGQASAVSFADLGYVDPQGHPRLRSVLAGYLRRSRDAVADPADVTVCASVTVGVSRVCRALASSGITHVGVEDPGWPRLRAAATAAGLTTVPIPVDDDGIRVEALAADPRVRAAIIAPAHQFPSGAVLSPARRLALLDWARDVDGVICEDDYDAEFRYDRRPVGTVQGVDPGRVVLFGSLSKTLSPALGLGWFVAPRRWSEAISAADPIAAVPPTLDQLAFAAFLDKGSYDRHLRGSRHRYRARRDAVVRALARELPECPVTGAAAGLHLLLHLPAGLDTGRVVRAAAARDVHVADLAAYRITEGSPGLVLGYGNLSDTSVDDAVTRLAAAL